MFCTYTFDYKLTGRSHKPMLIIQTFNPNTAEEKPIIRFTTKRISGSITTGILFAAVIESKWLAITQFATSSAIKQQAICSFSTHLLTSFIPIFKINLKVYIHVILIENIFLSTDVRSYHFLT